MNNEEFKSYLERQNTPKLTTAGIKSRISKGKKAESILGKSLDDIVCSSDLMLKALNALQDFENPQHNQMQNAVRKYYAFRNGSDFPRKHEIDTDVGEN